MSYTIVGVIGHIDHGKTSLVAALSGIDTDTHPEEKRRGITIDLGFASFQHNDQQFALIDAPGHQKYIGNLLAGVSGIDVGLLVVACDQGIQAQTLEHAAIIQSLGVKKLIVAISRIDMADENRLIELSEELEVFLADYGFFEIPIIPLSSVTGEGLDALKSKLCEYVRQSERSASEFFRLPIDRVFQVEGRGCVVAGTTWSGQVSIGDSVEVAGTKHVARVREIETHGTPTEQSELGQRTALNLVGVSAREVSRGDELVLPGSHPTTNRILVDLQMFPETQPLKCPAIVQLHSATSACAAKVSGVKRLSAGEQAVVVVETEQPVVVTLGQQILLRRPYPVGSFAGGRVLASIPELPRTRQRIVDFANKLTNESALERLVAWVDYFGEIAIDKQWFQMQLGIGEDSYEQLINEGLAEERFLKPKSSPDRIVSPKVLEIARDYVVKMLTQQASDTDDAWSTEDSVVRRAKSTGSDALIQTAINELVSEKQLVRLGRMVAVASDKTRLSKKQRGQLQQIAELYQSNRTPPTLKELAKHLGTAIDAANSLVRFATQQKLLIDLGGGFLVGDQVFRELCVELQGLFESSAELSAAEIKDGWQLTRKHAIPLLEYCDAVGVTQRNENQRSIGPNLQDYT